MVASETAREQIVTGLRGSSGPAAVIGRNRGEVEGP